MRERPILFSGPMVRAILAGTKTQTRRVVKPQPAGEWAAPGRSSCPYGQPNDRLWARETFRFAASLDTLAPNAIGEKALDAGYHTPWAPTQFEADGQRMGAWHGFDTPPAITSPGKLRPAIHLPRWACRLVLEISAIRLERLQAISEADPVAEGVEIADRHRHQLLANDPKSPAVRAFRDLWCGINGVSSWAKNPWVWVVDFMRADTDKKEA